jgi:hypothetical protein
MFIFHYFSRLSEGDSFVQQYKTVGISDTRIDVIDAGTFCYIFLFTASLLDIGAIRIRACYLI